MTTPTALLIAGLGTRDEAAAEAFRDFVRELGRSHPDVAVDGGFVELSRPPLGEAVDRLVERGAERVTVVPLALVPTPRVTDRLPAALRHEEERHPGLSCVLGGPLGAHPSLLAALERRLDEALGTGARTPEDRAGTTVLLVGQGSTDPEANAEVHRAARLLWEGRGYAGVEPAFVSSAAPDVPWGLDRCHRLGARRIVVLPYVLFAGVLTERMRRQAEGWASAHPDTEVLCADALGPAEELAGVVMERHRESAASVDEADSPRGLVPACSPTQASPGGSAGDGSAGDGDGAVH